MDNENIIVELTYSVKDIRRPLIKAARSGMISTALYVFLVLFITYVVAARFVTVEVSEPFRLGALVFLIMAPLLTVAINLVGIERKARASATVRSDPVRLEITTAGITASEVNRSATLEWAAYKRAVEFSDRFELVSDRNRGLLLPKRCFDCEQSVKSFRDLLERSLNGKVEHK